MGGTARKSTHRKKSIGKKKSRGKESEPVVVDVDPDQKYAIDLIGPVHLTWAKRKKVNEKGKIVKEYYLCRNEKHSMWVKWEKPFEDKFEVKDKFMTTWSAEPQSLLTADGKNKIAVEEALRKKVVWPWVRATDEGYKERLAILKKGGYKEWRPVGRQVSGTSWKVKFALDPSTETDKSTDSSDESTSTDAGADEENDEEDDEV